VFTSGAEHTGRRRLKELFTFNGTFGLMVGVLNSTSFVYGQNRSICQQDMTLIRQNFVTSVAYIRGNPGFFNIFTFVDQLLEVPKLVNTIVFSCYFGSIELGPLRDNYLKTVADFSIL
jgi:hypothetical protein